MKLAESNTGSGEPYALQQIPDLGGRLRSSQPGGHSGSCRTARWRAGRRFGCVTRRLRQWGTRWSSGGGAVPRSPGGGAPRGSAPAPSSSYGAPAAPNSGPSHGYVPPQSRGDSSGTAAAPSGACPTIATESHAYGPGGYGHGIYVAPSRFYHPYYSFVPRWRLGFGMWVGSTVAFSLRVLLRAIRTTTPTTTMATRRPGYGYAAPGRYPRQVPRRAALHGPGSSVIAQPGAAAGSVSFEMTPATAEVFIDGEYITIV